MSLRPFIAAESAINGKVASTRSSSRTAFNRSRAGAAGDTPRNPSSTRASTLPQQRQGARDHHLFGFLPGRRDFRVLDHVDGNRVAWNTRFRDPLDLSLNPAFGRAELRRLTDRAEALGL